MFYEHVTRRFIIIVSLTFRRQLRYAFSTATLKTRRLPTVCDDHDKNRFCISGCRRHGEILQLRAYRM